MKKDDVTYYIDRSSGQRRIERIVGARVINFCYRKGWRQACVDIAARYSIFSFLYGLWQKMPWTKRNILPFALEYGVEIEECEKPLADFKSLNDFFTRKLKKGSRSFAQGPETCIVPADARYLVYPEMDPDRQFSIKGKEFCLSTFLGSRQLADKYHKGSLVVARLAPMDYHRFHFPCDCIPGRPRLINGQLLSVHPMALHIKSYFTVNKRVVTELKTDKFGDVLFVEIGALNVGSIKQTYVPGRSYKKGDEKGYFGLGASALVMVFEFEKIAFDEDLKFFSTTGIEVLCLLGQSLGNSLKKF